MKTCLMLILFNSLFFVKLFSQKHEQNPPVPVDYVTGLITYKNVVNTEGTKQELYDRVIDWVNKFYVNPVDATKVRSPESGVVEIQHRFKIYNTDAKGVKTEAGIVNYNLKIELRDGRYRYTLDNYTLRHVSRFPVERWLDRSDPNYTPVWDDYLQQINAFTGELVSNLTEAMKPVAKKTEEPW